MMRTTSQLPEGGDIGICGAPVWALVVHSVLIIGAVLLLVILLRVALQQRAEMVESHEMALDEESRAMQAARRFTQAEASLAASSPDGTKAMPLKPEADNTGGTRTASLGTAS